jgi:hypothetical protein
MIGDPSPVSDRSGGAGEFDRAHPRRRPALSYDYRLRVLSSLAPFM